MSHAYRTPVAWWLRAYGVAVPCAWHCIVVAWLLHAWCVHIACLVRGYRAFASCLSHICCMFVCRRCLWHGCAMGVALQGCCVPSLSHACVAYLSVAGLRGMPVYRMPMWHACLSHARLWHARLLRACLLHDCVSQASVACLCYKAV